MTQQAVKNPTLVDAAIPVACLIVMLSRCICLVAILPMARIKLP